MMGGALIFGMASPVDFATQRILVRNVRIFCIYSMAIFYSEYLLIIIQHLEREARTIRDLFIECLSIKNSSEHPLKHQ
ncbi:hypothetical protein C9J51_01630 [Photobacterium iliopiscarium]|nr:hypothetical protein C9J51_01630 [Photobacterium iliopiscarium]